MSLLAHVSAGSSSGNGVTTGAIDTTGATFLVAAVSDFGVTPSTFSDSKGNTWNARTRYLNGVSAATRIYWCAPTSVGSGHTFTSSGTATFSSVAVLAFDGGVPTYDVENGTTANSVTTLQPGSVTPTQTNSLVISSLAFAAFTQTIDGGFTIPESAIGGANNVGAAISYLQQTSIAAANPTWTDSGSGNMEAAIAVFHLDVVPTGSALLSGIAPSLIVGLGVALGSLSLSGQSVALQTQNSTQVGGIVFVGQAPALITQLVIPVGVGSASIQGNGLSLQRTIGLGVGSETFSGVAPSLSYYQAIAVPAGIVSISGQVPEVVFAETVPVGNIALNGLAPTAIPTLQRTPDTGTTIISGGAVGAQESITVPVGSIALVGLIFGEGEFIDPPVGAVGITGVASALITLVKVPVGSLAISGVVPSLNATLGIPLGSIGVTGLPPGSNLQVGVGVGSLAVVGIHPISDLWAQPSSGAIGVTGYISKELLIVAVPSGAIVDTGNGPASFFQMTVARLLIEGRIPIVATGLSTTAPVGRRRFLLDPRLRNVMPEHWPSKGTIQRVTFITRESGQPIATGGGVDIVGMINIQCRVGPIIEVRPTDNEVRDRAIIENYTRRQAKLNGYFPQIVPRTMRFVLDGVDVMEIRGVEHDSEHFSTRLLLEVIYPNG